MAAGQNATIAQPAEPRRSASPTRAERDARCEHELRRRGRRAAQGARAAARQRRRAPRINTTTIYMASSSSTRQARGGAQALSLSLSSLETTAHRARAEGASARAPRDIAYAQAQQARGKAGYAKALDAYARATKLTLAQHGGDARGVPAFLWNNVAVLRHEMAELPEATAAYERRSSAGSAAADAAAAAASCARPPRCCARRRSSTSATASSGSGASCPSACASRSAGTRSSRPARSRACSPRATTCASASCVTTVAAAPHGGDGGSREALVLPLAEPFRAFGVSTLESDELRVFKKVARGGAAPGGGGGGPHTRRPRRRPRGERDAVGDAQPRDAARDERRGRRGGRGAGSSTAAEHHPHYARAQPRARASATARRPRRPSATCLKAAWKGAQGVGGEKDDGASAVLAKHVQTDALSALGRLCALSASQSADAQKHFEEIQKMSSRVADQIKAQGAKGGAAAAAAGGGLGPPRARPRRAASSRAGRTRSRCSRSATSSRCERERELARRPLSRPGAASRFRASLVVVVGLVAQRAPRRRRRRRSGLAAQGRPGALPQAPAVRGRLLPARSRRTRLRRRRERPRRRAARARARAISGRPPSRFSRVREARGTIAPTTTARDASLNLAHAHLLQKRFVDAASRYQSVLKTRREERGSRRPRARKKPPCADPRSVGAAPARRAHGLCAVVARGRARGAALRGLRALRRRAATAQKDKRASSRGSAAFVVAGRSATSLSRALLHARPGDLPAPYNLAIVLESWAVRVLTEVAEDTGGKRHKADGGNERRSLKEVEEGVENIRARAPTAFGWLGEQGEPSARRRAARARVLLGRPRAAGRPAKIENARAAVHRPDPRDARRTIVARRSGARGARGGPARSSARAAGDHRAAALVGGRAAQEAAASGSARAGARQGQDRAPQEPRALVARGGPPRPRWPSSAGASLCAART